MSKLRGRRRVRAAQRRDERPPRKTLLERIVRLPRLARIVLVAFIALMVVLAVFPLIDRLYVALFFSPTTLILPSLVATGVGLVMYVIGWLLLVGTVGTQPIIQRGLRWYLGIGGIAIMIDIVLIIQGITMTDAVAG